MRLHETHISWLFFTGQFVYKVKKPVNFDFLDFSTLQKRHFYCNEEKRLNTRLAPGVYLGTVGVIHRGDQFIFGRSGNPVEYAVKMRQLPQNRWLSTLLRNGEVEPDLIRRIARRLAEFHAKAETNERITRIGGLEGLWLSTKENFLQTQRFIGTTISRKVYDTVSVYTEVFKEVNEELFRQREAKGRIREGHGDLHAAQICAENGLSIIDCIEFNKRLRYGDVAADLAFLAMDLDHYQRHDLAEVLIKQYIRCTNDIEIHDLLPFLKCYRAYVRGKVESLRQDQLQESHSAKEQAIVERAEEYFNLAHDYALLKGPLLMITTGLMGSGKSTLAKAISTRLKATLFVSDKVRKELANVTLGEPRFDAWGEGIYSSEYHRRTYETLHHRALSQLQEGAIVIVDASYGSRVWREQARGVARDAGAAFLVIEIYCPEAMIRQRLSSRHQQKGSISDGRIELLESQKFHYQPPDEVSQHQRIVVDASLCVDNAVSTTLREIYRSQLSP